MEQGQLTFNINFGDERHQRQQQKRQDKALSQRLRADRKRKRVMARAEEAGSVREEVNTAWMSCLCCHKVVPIGMIVNKQFNICEECR